jgi:hypothetical protein
MSKRMNCRLSDSLYTAVRQRADTAGISVTELVLHALEAYLTSALASDTTVPVPEAPATSTATSFDDAVRHSLPQAGYYQGEGPAIRHTSVHADAAYGQLTMGRCGRHVGGCGCQI